jgi:hypothetical protein
MSNIKPSKDPASKHNHSELQHIKLGRTQTFRPYQWETSILMILESSNLAEVTFFHCAIYISHYLFVTSYKSKQYKPLTSDTLVCFINGPQRFSRRCTHTPSTAGVACYCLTPASFLGGMSLAIKSHFTLRYLRSHTQS